MDSETKQAIDSLRELFITKFDGLEQILEIKDATSAERRANQAAKDAEQDTKITVLEDRVSILEKAPAEKTQTTWEKIKSKVIDYLIPFFFMVLIYWIAQGAPMK